MERTPHIAQRLLQMTLDELDAAREWMLLLGRKTAREKIASLLSIVARRDASIRHRKMRGRLTFDLPLTREAMADYLGLTLETVSRQMSALKRDGVIELEGKRHGTVPDMERLLVEAGLGWGNFAASAIAHSLAAGRVRCVAFKNTGNGLVVPIHLVWMKDRPLGVAARSFLQLLTASETLAP